MASSSTRASQLATLAAILLAAAVLLGATSHAEGTSNITFVLEKKADFGQGFVIVGNDPALGDWDPAKAPLLTVTGDSTWSVTVELPEGKSLEYKPVLVVYDTKEVLTWFPGSNLHITVNVIRVYWPDNANSNIVQVIN